MANKVKHYKILTDPGSYDVSSWYAKQKAGDKFDLILTGDDGVPHTLDAITAAQLASALGDYAELDAANTFTVAGNVFSHPLTVADATVTGHAVNLGQMEAVELGLQNQIDALQSSLGPPLNLDCTSNPNYPSGDPGDNWIVTGAGKVGGASGVDVEIGDWIICKTTSAGGTQAAVGTNYFIVQRNVGVATDTVLGIFRMATDVEAASKTGNAGFLTPGKGSLLMDAAAVRFDKSQSLTSPQQAQARTNIGALGSADLSNYYNKTESDGRYGRLASNNAWTMHQAISPANTSQLDPANNANSFLLTRGSNGVFLALVNGSSDLSATIRSYQISGIQLALSEGGVSTSNHGDSSQWQGAYNWVNTNGAAVLAAQEWAQESW